MKKISTLFLALFSVSTAFAAPNLVLKPFNQNNSLGTIKIIKGTNAFYKIDLYFMVADESNEFESHIETQGAYHPFLDKRYIVNQPTSTPIGKIIRSEAKLIVQSCSTKSFTECSVVKQEYLNLDVNESDITGIIPNQIEVTL
ncbi:MAG: hypothetical protein KBB94_08575 [Legionellaceae bacterium]|nr:hypothetical protein [Legionellaceae bacterium]MBP9776091.1 hypothetical protein [Legionellaceae bacterium]